MGSLSENGCSGCDGAKNGQWEDFKRKERLWGLGWVFMAEEIPQKPTGGLADAGG